MKVFTTWYADNLHSPPNYRIAKYCNKFLSLIDYRYVYIYAIFHTGDGFVTKDELLGYRK
jgi:hypothetical protein